MTHAHDAIATDVRDSRIAFFDHDHWVNSLLLHYAGLANREIWNFDVTIGQNAQFAEYGPGGHYGWHQDELGEPLDRSHGMRCRLTRKLTVSLNLTEPRSFDDGALFVKDRWGMSHQLNESRNLGTVVVFPSYVYHSVEVVTRGNRHSLVSWILGPPFR